MSRFLLIFISIFSNTLLVASSHDENTSELITNHKDSTESTNIQDQNLTALNIETNPSGNNNRDGTNIEDASKVEKFAKLDDLNISTTSQFSLFTTLAPKVTVTINPNNRIHARFCILESKVPLAVVLKYREGDFAMNPEEGKCFMKCFSERVGYIDLEGNPNQEKCVEYITKHTMEEEKATEIFQNCKKVEVGEGKCDFAFNMYKCFFEHIIQKTSKRRFNWLTNSEDDFDENTFKANLRL